MGFRFSSTDGFGYRPGSVFLGRDEFDREIGIETEIHLITIGGSGAGKGSSLLVPNARRWRGNLICIDPKGENAVLAWQAREAMGQQVAVLDPFFEIPAGKIPDRLRVSINPLAVIDPGNRRARAALMAIGNGLVVVHDPKHMEWVEGARALLAGIAAYIVADAPPEMRTFAVLRKLLMQPDAELYEDAKRMADDTRIGGLIRAAGISIMTALDSEKSMERDFLGNARRATQWLDDESIAASLEESTFSLSDLKTGEASLFLVLPADYLADYSGFLRLFVKSALHAMGTQADNGRECLFLLDEFYSLGKLDELTEAAGRMRSYGVHLWPFVQGLNQLYSLYGREGAQTFMTNADAQIFLGNDKDKEALAFISERIGNIRPDEIEQSAPDVTWTPTSYAEAQYTMKRSARWGFLGDQKMGESEQSLHRRFDVEDENQRRALETLNENRRRATDVENENRRRATEAENAKRRAEYDHRMRKVGQPRLAPDEIAALIGKIKMAGEDVARSMIVFGPAGTVWNLQPAPYFSDALPRPVPSQRVSKDRAVSVSLLKTIVDFWIRERGLSRKLVAGFLTFPLAAPLVAQIPGMSQATFLPSMLLAVIVLPPILYGRFGTNWIIAVAFALGAIAAHSGEQEAERPQLVAMLLGGFFTGGCAWLIRAFWRSFVRR